MKIGINGDLLYIVFDIRYVKPDLIEKLISGVDLKYFSLFRRKNKIVVYFFNDEKSFEKVNKIAKKLFKKGYKEIIVDTFGNSVSTT